MIKLALFLFLCSNILGSVYFAAKMAAAKGLVERK